MELSKIPGLNEALAEAAAEETRLRDHAFLALPEEICGVPVRPLTPRTCGILFASKNPLLCGGKWDPLAEPEQILMFLWIVSPRFSRTDAAARAAFIAEHSACLECAAALRAIDDFLRRQLFDAPPGAQRGGRIVNTSWLASLVHRHAAAYGWRDEVLNRRGEPVPDAGILDKPLPRLFQYLREMQNDAGDVPAFNPLQDRIRARMVREFFDPHCAVCAHDEVKIIEPENAPPYRECPHCRTGGMSSRESGGGSESGVTEVPPSNPENGEAAP